MWAVAVALLASTLEAQPFIEHSGLDCMRPGEFVVVLSGINPEDDVQTAKVYFRSRLYPDFYYVEMRYTDGQFVGILPEPSPETPGVVYYVEALDSTFNTARSVEYQADIEPRCRQESAAAYFPGGDPGITVGATTPGSPGLPPGFTAAGVVGTITAAGLLSGVGGGIGTGAAVAVGVAAAAGAGAGVAVLSSSDDDASSTTTSTNVAGLPTTTTSPNPGPGPQPTTTTTPGGPQPTSTTTTVPGGTTTTTTDDGGTTSTTSSSTTTTVAPVLDANCFNVEALGSCTVRVDATCVALPVDEYEWVLDLMGRWKRFDFPNAAPTLTHTWSEADGCDADGETLRFRLKVDRGDETSTAHKNLFVPGHALKAGPGKLEVRLVTHLASSTRASGRVLVNGKPLRAIESGAPVEMRTPVQRGENSIVAMTSASSEPAATWRFELAPIVPGSLRVVFGNVLALEPGAVVFQLSGRPGERVELTFLPRE